MIHDAAFKYQESGDRSQESEDRNQNSHISDFGMQPALARLVECLSSVDIP